MILGLEPRCLLSGLGDDIALISQNENPSFPADALSDATGGNPWNTSNPPQFYSMPTQTYNNSFTSGGLTYTNSSTSTITASISGNPSSGGSSSSSSSSSGGSGSGGPWSETSDAVNTASSSVTGTNADGLTVTDSTSLTSEKVITASSSGDGVINFQVTLTLTASTSNGLSGGAGGSYSLTQGQTQSENLMDQGQVDTSGHVTGSFTFAGAIGTTFALNDGAGTPESTSPSYSVGYNTSTGETANTSGSLGDSSQLNGTFAVTSSETGGISNTDGQGGFDGVSRGDGDTITTTVASKPGTSNPGGGATTGTVSASGPTTQLQIPSGKITTYVIDTADQGWFSWSGAQRTQYASAHGFDPNKVPTGNVVNGTGMLAGLAPPNGQVNAGPAGVIQVVKDLAQSLSQVGGQADVLVIGDHGGPGVQVLGEDALTPELAPNYDSLLDEVVGFVRSGGTLVLAGCEVFGTQSAIDDWQAYATDRNITIMGSASPTGYSQGSVTGVWITLVPGGTAPTLGR